MLAGAGLPGLSGRSLDRWEGVSLFVPGERAEVEGPFASASDWRIGGSAFYQRFDSLRQQLVPFYREFDAVRARYERDVAGGSTARRPTASARRPISP